MKKKIWHQIRLRLTTDFLDQLDKEMSISGQIASGVRKGLGSWARSAPRLEVPAGERKKVAVRYKLETWAEIKMAQLMLKRSFERHVTLSETCEILARHGLKQGRP